MPSDVPAEKSIQADRDFDIQDLLVKLGLLLNIPAFCRSKSAHFKESEVVATQNIACVRIHVERANGLVKKQWHILGEVIHDVWHPPEAMCLNFIELPP